jgi:hypothetical protein
MVQDTNDNTETPHSANIPPPEGQWELEALPEDMAQYAPLLSGLTVLQSRILWVLVNEMGSEEQRTETQIADDMGISRSTIRRARRNPAFQNALAIIARDSLRGIHDKIIGRIVKAGEKDWTAGKFLLQYDGSYVPKTQNMNLNANISPNTRRPSSLAETIDGVLIRLGELGWTRERVAGLSERFDELRKEGAF